MPLGAAMGLLLQCQSQGVPVGPLTGFPGSFYADPPVRAVNKKEKLRESTAICVISWDDTQGSCLDDWGVKMYREQVWAPSGPGSPGDATGV